MGVREPAIGVLVVAYNAVGTLAGVLDRIPAEFRPRIREVIVADDSSSDSTYLVGLGYKQVVSDLPLTVIRNERNLGYGGNQKLGYKMAMERGLDIVVLLHGDGQYAPEMLPDIVAPLEREECQAVFGSRMLIPGAARRGGMPLYKLVGNRILTRTQNALLHTNLSEFHSGYRAYSVATLRELDLDAMSDGFDFDTEIIIGLHDRRKVIKEVPIPTYYGDEICYVNGLKYAVDVLADVLRYRLGSARPHGLARRVHLRDQPPSLRESDLVEGRHTANRRVLERLAGLPSRQVLQLGCATGILAEHLRRLGHSVTGVDSVEFPGIRDHVDTFVQSNPDGSLPRSLGKKYGAVVATDALNRSPFPEVILSQIAESLADDGIVFVTLPNFGHWYVRTRVLTGAFDYDDQGLLDRGHLRFFTRKSFRSMAEAAGLRLGSSEVIPVPAERVFGRSFRRSRFVLSLIERVLARIWPTLFAYQFVLELSKSCSQSEPEVMSAASEVSGVELDPDVAAPNPTLKMIREIEAGNEALR